MDRLYRILGRDFVDMWIENGTLEFSHHELANKDLSDYDTPEKREKLFKRKPTIPKINARMIMLHPNYTLAAIENFAWCVEYEKAQMIQKRVRGWLDREKLWSPYTEIGQRRLLKIFSS